MDLNSEPDPTAPWQDFDDTVGCDIDSLEGALRQLRRAVSRLDTAPHRQAKEYWAERVNLFAHEVNIQIHLEFPEHHNHPGPYRPYRPLI